MLYKSILLALLCALVQGVVKHPERLKETLPGYAVTAAIDQLNSTKCRTEMEQYRDAVTRGVLWSLRMLDANGEPGSGFLSGNNYWLGKRVQCDFLSRKIPMEVSDEVIRNISIYRNPTDEFPPYELHYFAAHVRHNSTLQDKMYFGIEDVIVLGLCLPASCTSDDVGVMLKKIFDDRILTFGQLYSADFTLIKVSDLIDDHKWLLSGKILTIIFILAALLGLVIVATIYDVYIYKKACKNEKELLTFENNNTSELKNDGAEKREHDQEDVVLTELKPHNRFGQILMCFSSYSNIKRVFQTDNSSEDMLIFHGLRFFGMGWIILAHFLYYNLNIIANKSEGYKMSSQFENQILCNATLSVDTFFFLSGFLLMYGFQKMQSKDKKTTSLRKNSINFVYIFLKRYIRLTPAYMTMIMIAILNFSWHEKLSPMFFHERTHELCSKYWWRNILYINNFFDWESSCMTWSWYLSNDMQFFVYGTFLFMLSCSYFYIAVGLGIATIVLSSVLHAYTVYSLEYIPTMDSQFRALNQLYVLPWLRIPPYLIGMAVALYLTKRDFKLPMSKRTVALGWCFGILCNCSILFGSVHKKMPLGASIIYVSFQRTAWAFGIAWLVIVCTTGHGSIINKFLSLKMWVPLSRLVYCVYLLNPFIIMSVSMGSNFTHDVELLITGCMSLGILLITYVCAIGLSVWIEIPCIVLLRLVNNPNRRMK